ncbi:hypothetical protein Dimus_032535 [Dionaea muscipula]
MPISGGSASKRRCQLQEGDSNARVGSKLPENVVVEIMARLPVKPLIRFKCVCKRWFFIIGSDHLAAKQLVAGRSCDYDKFDCLLSDVKSYGGEFSLYSLDTFLGSYPSRRALKFFPLPQPSFHRIISFAAPLDGILCLKISFYKMGEVFILWNPATGEAKPIPLLTKPIHFFGLARDPRTDKYKILGMTINDRRGGNFDSQRSITANVYSLDVGSSSSSWKALDLSYFFDGSRCIDDLAIKNMLHSMIPSSDGRMLSMPGRYKVLGSYGSGSYMDAMSVVSFDSSDEIYIQTPMPPSSEFRAGYYINMDRLIYCLNHGATCALIFCPRSAPRPKEIWVLIGCGGRGSWTKQISMDYNLHPWCRVVDDRYANNIYYKQSLVSIPQIPMKEDDCIESDLHFSIDEVYPSDHKEFGAETKDVVGRVYQECLLRDVWKNRLEVEQIGGGGSSDDPMGFLNAGWLCF